MRNACRFIAIVLALIAADAVNGSFGRGSSAYTQSPYAKAARIARLAERGDAKAQAELGWLYLRGRGVPQSYHLAAKWFYRAAEQGQGGAQFELGLLYNKGQGVRHNLVLAHMWMNLSAAQAVGDRREFIVNMRDLIASNMTVWQVKKAQRLAQEWTEVAPLCAQYGDNYCGSGVPPWALRDSSAAW